MEQSITISVHLRWKTTSAPSLEKPVRPLVSQPSIDTVLEGNDLLALQPISFCNLPDHNVTPYPKPARKVLVSICLRLALSAITTTHLIKSCHLVSRLDSRVSCRRKYF